MSRQEYVRVSALAERLGRSTQTIRNWIREGQFPGAFQRQSVHYADSRPRKTRRGAWHLPLDEVERFLGQLRSGRV